MGMVEFNASKLKKSDRQIYDSMTEAERQSYERTWIAIEEKKLKLLQKKHASRERIAREKKIHADQERKERAHRLIERGAILESNIKDPQDFTQDEIKEIVEHTMQTQHMRHFIEEVRNRKYKETESNIEEPYGRYIDEFHLMEKDDGL